MRLPTGGTGFEQLPAPTNRSERSRATESTEGYVLECCEPGESSGRLMFMPHELMPPFDILPGDLVLIHGSVLHKSEKNRGQKTRFAYTFHMIESSPHAIYDEKNWLQPTKEMPFSRVLGP